MAVFNFKGVSILAESIVKPAAFIFCHGRGETGGMWWEMMKDHVASYIPTCNILLPTADYLKITRNNGQPEHAWFDSLGLPDKYEETCQGIDSSSQNICDLIQQCEKKGIPRDKIILGGYSQGAALALYVALKQQQQQQIQGLVVINGWIPCPQNLQVQGMQIPHYLILHGEADNVVDRSLGQQTYQALEIINKAVATGTAQNWKSLNDVLDKVKALQAYQEDQNSEVQSGMLGKSIHFKSTGHEVDVDMLQQMREFVAETLQTNRNA